MLPTYSATCRRLAHHRSPASYLACLQTKSPQDVTTPLPPPSAYATHHPQGTGHAHGSSNGFAPERSMNQRHLHEHERRILQDDCEREMPPETNDIRK